MTTPVKIAGRLAFPTLFEAKSQDGGEPRYSGLFILVDHATKKLKVAAAEQEKLVRDAIAAEATAKWGAKAPVYLKSLYASGDTCLRDGNTKAHLAGFEGRMFVSASQRASKGRPTVVNGAGSLVAAGERGAPYSGCYVVAYLDIWAQDNQNGKRINAFINTVQFWCDGEAFGGSSKPIDQFDDLSAEAEEDLA